MLSAQLALLGRPAGARGLDTYIRTPKPPQPPELIAAAVLLAREELTQFGAAPLACCARAALSAARTRRESAEVERRF